MTMIDNSSRGVWNVSWKKLIQNVVHIIYSLLEETFARYVTQLVAIAHLV